MSNVIEPHLYESPGGSTKTCFVCGEPEDRPIHHVVPEGWCLWDEEDHVYDNGECRRCGAEEPWNDEDGES